MKKKQNKRKASALPKAASKKNSPRKKEKIVPLYPPDLPLSEKWYTYADLVIMIQVKRGAIYRYIQKGILRKHYWGGTPRFNKTYVDWMFENGGKKLSWFGWLIAITHNFDWMIDMMAA
jgi:hypothetical protein